MRKVRARRALAAVVACGLTAGVLSAAGATVFEAQATASACTAVNQPLGPATGWTEFIETGGRRGSESEGAIAWGGDLDASGMTVGTRLTSASSAATLVVGGRHGQWFNLQRGSAYLNPASGVNFNGGGRYLATNPIDFASAFSVLRATSDAWGSVPGSGTASLGVVGGNTVLVLMGTDPRLNVFSLSQAQLSSGNGVAYDVPDGSAVLVNVAGTSVTLQGQMWVRQGSNYQQANDIVMASWPGVIWNFPDATTVTMNFGSAWGGTILAPRALLDVRSVGHTIGQIIARSFASNFETHQRLLPASMCLPVPPSPPVDPGPSARSDVRISKSVSASSVVGGQRVTYRLRVENAGLATATGVTVRDVLPAGVTYGSDSAGCARSGATLTCAAPDLAPGASTTIDVAVLADPIAGAGPAPDPQAYHELKPYKTEAQVDLEPGETRTVTLGCAGAGIVSDGSVRVDHVDQGTGSLTDVQVLSAASTGPGTWKAVVRNHATGRGQAKAFAVCLPGATEVADRQTGHADGHAHTLSADADQVVSSRAWNVGRHSTTLACPNGSTPIAPGYSLSGGSARLVGSEPTSSGAWELTFGVDAPTTATVSVRCLRTTTSAEEGHTHDLRFTHVVRTVSVPADQNVEEQVSCPDDAKGVLATWDLPAGLVPLGNDPRLKSRAFRLLNTTGSSLTGTVDLVCLNDRTAVESMGHDAPVLVANTATVASTTVDADPGNNSSTATVTVLPGSATAALLGRADLRSGHLAVSVVSAMPGRGLVTVRRGGVAVTEGVVRLRPGRRTTATLRVTARERRALRSAARVRVIVVPDRGPRAVGSVTLQREHRHGQG